MRRIIKQTQKVSSHTKNLVKEGVAQGRYPRYLYKYCVANYKKNPHFHTIISSNRLHFSSPKVFDDSFECQMQPVVFSVKNATLFLKRFLPKAPEDVVDSLLKKAIEDPAGFAKIMDGMIKIADKGVLCLAQQPDNIMLWGHYADNHRGVCLKFDILKDLDFFSTPLNVIYARKYPAYNHLKSADEIAKLMIQTKFESWSYEREVRIVRPKTGQYNFDNSSLTEIIFGCETPLVEIDRIKTLTSINDYEHLIFKRAVKRIGAYGLIIQPL
jgi:hypothetical protein